MAAEQPAGAGGDATPGPAAELGASLAAARERLGMSVEDVCYATRIRTHIVRDLEAGRFESSGAAVYARGHLRVLAALLDLDVDAVTAQFDRCSGGVQPVLPALARTVAGPPREVARAERGSAGWASAMIAVLVLVSLVSATSFVLGQLQPRRSSTDSLLTPLDAVGGTTPAGREPAPARSQPSPRATAAPPRATAAPPRTTAAPPRTTAAPPRTTAAPPRATAAPPAGRATAPVGAAPPQAPRSLPAPPAVPAGEVGVLVRTGADPSWLRVVGSSGGVVYEGILAGGTVRNFTDPRQLRMRFGNSHAVSLVFNGRRLAEPLCKPMVCTVAFAPTGMTAG